MLWKVAQVPRHAACSRQYNVRESRRYSPRQKSGRSQVGANYHAGIHLALNINEQDEEIASKSDINTVADTLRTVADTDAAS
jgi:hypothetical protein